MGGPVNVAFRLKDGRAICQTRWTNECVQWLMHPRMFVGDDEYVADFLRSADDYDTVLERYGRFDQVRDASYGLIVFDFVSNTILDNNDYSNLRGFVPVQAMNSARERFLACADAGRISVEMARYVAGEVFSAFTSSPLPPHVAKAMAKDGHDAYMDLFLRSNTPLVDVFYSFGIDTSPMTFLHYERSRADTMAMRKKLRELGFPMKQSEGLNQGLRKAERPVLPLSAGEVHWKERCAREMFQDIKQKRKILSGVRFSELTEFSQAEFFRVAEEVNNSLAPSPALRVKIETLIEALDPEVTCPTP